MALGEGLAAEACAKQEHRSGGAVGSRARLAPAGGDGGLGDGTAAGGAEGLGSRVTAATRELGERKRRGGWSGSWRRVVLTVDMWFRFAGCHKGSDDEGESRDEPPVGAVGLTIACAGGAVRSIEQQRTEGTGGIDFGETVAVLRPSCFPEGDGVGGHGAEMRFEAVAAGTLKFARDELIDGGGDSAATPAWVLDLRVGE